MIYTKNYPAPEINERECLRYAGTNPKSISEEEKALEEELANSTEDVPPDLGL